jgi:Spy/CpxP family protein refolding chaperone
MITKRILGLALLLWLVLPAPARSEEMPPGRWWRQPRIADRLNLNEDQKRRLDDRFYSNRRRLIELKGALEREQLEVRRLLEKEPMDEAAVMTQFKNMDEARGRLARERFYFVVEIRKILGYERFQRLENMFGQFKPRMLRRSLDQSDEGHYQDGGGGGGNGSIPGRGERFRRWLRQ